MNHEQELTLRRQLIDTAIANTGKTNLSKGWVMDICRATDINGNEHTGYLTNDGEGGLDIHEEVGDTVIVVPVDKSTVEFVARAEYCIDWRPRARYQQEI